MPQPYEPEYPEHEPAPWPDHPTKSGALPPQQPPTDVEEYKPDTGRVHIAARRRGADVLAVGSLALHLPHAVASLAVVAAVGYALKLGTGLPLWATVTGWLFSGALVFHHPTEAFLARYVFHHRPPSLVETDRLGPVWRGVAARFGADSTAYQLWINESDDLNAEAAAGHIVAVTTASLRLPPDQLAAVLAHELSHHLAGHSWSSLLSFWYALPGQLVWRALRFLHQRRLPWRTRSEKKAGRRLVLVAVVIAVVALLLFPWLLLVLVTPWLIAAVSRRAELRADRAAARHGFGPELAAVLQRFITEAETTGRPASDRHDRLVPAPSLLSSHPDHHTRLQRLQRYLQPSGR
ncbi:M48 family metalloprotease [Streptomyces sp. NPDC046821]|uniref:M48 family metalloprotease n=1 Tax=Streptomyces sp. NPDC046821 TaxID=3154702 RepID=UPI0033D09EC6